MRPMTERSASNHGRVPPQNLDAERSLLGGILLDGQAFDDVVGIVSADEFYREAHRKIFEAMTALHEKSQPIDRVTVKDGLTAAGAFEAAGGDAFIDLLDQFVPTATNLAYYAKIVHEKALGRRFIEAANTIARLAYEQHGDFAAFADESERRILAVREQRQISGWKPVGVILRNTLNRLEVLGAHPGLVTGMATGLDDLDLLTGGLRKGQLVILGARPKMGKSILALQIAKHVSFNGIGAGIFSLEMTEEEIGPRLLSNHARVDALRMRSGKFTESDWERMTNAVGAMGDLRLFIDDSMCTSVLDIRAKARQLKRRFAGEGIELGLIVVDYLQLAGEFGERREQEIAAISRGLKMLAKELGVCVLALSQLNRALEKREDKRPQPSDLRDSGSLEQDADAILFLYRDEVYNPETTRDMGIAELNVPMQRSGPPGFLRLAYLGEYMRFESLAVGGGEAA
jgi:replicative DNA helicase